MKLRERGGSAAFFIIVIFVVVGVGYYFYTAYSNPSSLQKTTSNTERENQNTENNKDNKAVKELTTTLSPARDLTGGWEGRATWRNNVANPACSYEGSLRLSLEQIGNKLEGTWQTTILKTNQLLNDVPCSQPGVNPEATLYGTVSSSEIRFSSSTIDFFATFTSDLMQGTFESCPNQYCSDGTSAVGFIGEFSLNRQ